MDIYEIWLDQSDNGMRMFEAGGIDGLEAAKEAARTLADTFAGMTEAGGTVVIKRVCVNVPARGTVYEIRLDEKK